MKKWMWLMAMVVTAVFLPSSSQAAKGFYIGADSGIAQPVMSGDFMDEAKPGLGGAFHYIDLGYGFTRELTVGLSYGGAIGSADEDALGHEASWNQGGFLVYGRYNFDKDKPLVPYVDLGLGGYIFGADSIDTRVSADGWTLGGKAAVGVHYFLGQRRRWFIGGELACHFVQYTGEADVHNEFLIFDWNAHKIDFNENASMLMLLFNFGYQFRPAAGVL